MIFLLIFGATLISNIYDFRVEIGLLITLLLWSCNGVKASINSYFEIWESASVSHLLTIAIIKQSSVWIPHLFKNLLTDTPSIKPNKQSSTS